MGEAALLVTFGQHISEATNGKALALAQSLRDHSIKGVDDTVPAYSSLLIIFRPEEIAVSELTELVGQRIIARTVFTSTGKRVEIPVEYGNQGGPDLDSLAQARGLTTDDVIRLHTSRPYKVFFIGFMPGFPYMGRVDRRLVTPRHASPRVRVAAGSVGIASDQTGIYPFASPGGWQIIGRTGVRLWDPERENPSLLLPGDAVQFHTSSKEPEQEAYKPIVTRPERPVFEVIEDGGMATVQDQGRPGYSNVGLSRGGAFDLSAAASANALVGNDPASAVLELTWSGPTMKATQNVTIALDGADLGCRVDSASVPQGMAWFVRSGSTVRISQSSPSRDGARAYLAIAGGVSASQVLGSRSTYLPGGFGGLSGRPLKAGDIIGSLEPHDAAPVTAGRFWPGRTNAPRSSHTVLRFIRYEGIGRADARSLETFMQSRWSVSEASDRMGIRLRVDNDRTSSSGGGEVVSFGVVKGAIQLPPDGNPVVLGPDHQTTGGYPLLGVVIEADFPILAQLRTGDGITFAEVGLEEALAERATARRDLLDGIAALRAGR